MQYIIKSKRDLKDLKDILVAKNIPFFEESKNMIKVQVNKELEEEFFLIVSYYTSYTAFRETVQTLLKKSHLDQERANEFFHQSCNYFLHSKYWVSLTKALITDYFSDKDTLHIESFATFNMKGFKAEIKDYVDNMISPKLVEAMPDEMPMQKGMGIQDVFAILKEQAIASGLDMDAFTKLHVFPKEKGMRIENSEGKIMDDAFFMEQLGTVLQVSSEEGDINPAIQDAMQLVCLCYIFNPNEIILHKGLSEDAKLAISQHEAMIQQNPSSQLQFVDCQGCDNCD